MCVLKTFYTTFLESKCGTSYVQYDWTVIDTTNQGRETAKAVTKVLISHSNREMHTELNSESKFVKIWLIFFLS